MRLREEIDKSLGLMGEIPIELASIDYDVEIAGPGKRTEVFMQGCYQNCEGCFNDTAKEFGKGRILTVADVVQIILEKTPNKNVTFCGGEPLAQPLPLSKIVKELKEREFHIMVYTGIYIEDIEEFTESASKWDRRIMGEEKDHTLKEIEIEIYRKAIMDILGNIDILVDGPFDLSKKQEIVPGKNYIGSSNQREIKMTERGEMA